MQLIQPQWHDQHVLRKRDFVFFHEQEDLDMSRGRSMFCLIGMVGCSSSNEVGDASGTSHKQTVNEPVGGTEDQSGQGSKSSNTDSSTGAVAELQRLGGYISRNEQNQIRGLQSQ